MSVFQEGRHLSFNAGADLSSSQYCIVKLSSGNVVLAAAGTDFALGVLANAPKQNDIADVVGRNSHGTFKVLLGGTVAAGDTLSSDSSGHAVTDTTAGHETLGIALEAGVSGQIIQYMPLSRTHA